MAVLGVLCWALIFILRLRFPPGSSIASNYIQGSYTPQTRNTCFLFKAFNFSGKYITYIPLAFGI